MANNNHNQASSYEIGYGKPPKSGQFKPGQSGNPSGKKKPSKSNDQIFEYILSNKLTITKNGRPQQVEAREIIAQQLANKAMKGDMPATRLLAQLGYLSPAPTKSNSDPNRLDPAEEIRQAHLKALQEIHAKATKRLEAKAEQRTENESSTDKTPE